MKKGFLKSRIKAFDYAFNGVKVLAKTEPAFQVEILATIAMIVLGIFFRISAIEWIIQIVLSVLLLSFEAVNTAIEELCDYVKPDHHKMIGRTKDFASGAVLIAACATIIIELIIYIPYILQYFNILQNS